MKGVEVSDSEEGFEVFYQYQSPKASGTNFSHLPSTQVSSVQEAPNIPDAMVLQQKSKTSLLELLKSHARGTAPEVAIQTKLPTPLPTQTSQPNHTNKKRKWDRKGKEVAEEGQSIPSKELEPQ